MYVQNSVQRPVSSSKAVTRTDTRERLEAVELLIAMHYNPRESFEIIFAGLGCETTTQMIGCVCRRRNSPTVDVVSSSPRFLLPQ